MSTLDDGLWPSAAVPLSSEWIARCIAAIVLADPELWIEEAHAIALEMSIQPVFRCLLPEAAVLDVFGPPRKFTAW
jgi:hypothetical protein